MGEKRPMRCPFKFENMWLKDQDLSRLIDIWWKGWKIEGSRMFGVVSKLKLLKQKLKEWNKIHFKKK